MDCPHCNCACIVIFANGTRYHLCMTCGWQKEHPYS